jgi:hypothetical protein
MEVFLSNRRRSALTSRALSLSITACALSTFAAPASAQGLFDFLFRPHHQQRRQPPPSANAYADPFPNYSPGPRLNDRERHAAPSGPSVVYCVRMCDGRYFPIQRNASLNPAQLCSSVCPASHTKTFAGSAIDQAVASDGTRYGALANAFAYRNKTVENCTCNGRDPYGLVALQAESDPTLRNGDIVATNDGFVAYNAGNRRSAEFTPIESHRGLSADMREQLAATKITPNNATRVSPDRLRGAAASAEGGERRVQLR